MKYRTLINIKGIVQGVGFRPFIYNSAKSFDLSGFVLNNTTGVSIEVEGDENNIKEFINNVKTQPPPQAEIFEIRSRQIEPLGDNEFVIRKSEDQDEKFVPISPELATCEDCTSELFSPDDRRYRYPFINCTNCGPRFTIVKDIPYDRELTTMSVFPMCDKCRTEYEDPTNRRFHAQPNACPVCGPQLSLLDSEGNKIDVEDVISETCRLLKEGNVLAIKGLGGYHLACDALNKEAVSKLRSRKYREYKPFALMVKDIPAARLIGIVNKEEELVLSGAKRPIVLLEKRPDAPVVDNVAPNQKYFGVMLPYTPLHHVLVKESGLILVMTSGNISTEPIVFEDRDAFDRLGGIADYYVVHNREIHIRTDDSVSRVWKKKEVILRRSRGYAPHPLLIKNPFIENILACGAELKNVFCLTRDNYAFLSHHIGDLENIETLSSFENGIEHFSRIFNIDPTFIAYDLHPEYLSTKYALSREKLKKLGVQHHFAHIVSCMVDNGIDEKVIGVAFDGTGYGTDGKIWGGEFLVCDYAGFQRAAHFEYIPLPGGEKAIKEPWRIAASMLYGIYGDEMMNLDIGLIKELDKEKWRILKQMIEKKINSPMTSSAGRLFDAISALTGVRREVYYEGQAAIELEMAADNKEGGEYPFSEKEHDGIKEIIMEPLIKGVISDLLQGTDTGSISAKFHNTVARITLNVCKNIRESTGLSMVALSGGVFQNNLLLGKIFDLLDRNGFSVYTHNRVPPNDGGIALGQAIIANEWIKKGKI